MPVGVGKSLLYVTNSHKIISPVFTVAYWCYVKQWLHVK